MILGGSTTSLLSLLNLLPKNKYSIDLQLYENNGVLIDEIPAHVNLLPQANAYKGKYGKIKKILKFISSGYVFKAIKINFINGKIKLFSNGKIADFQAKILSRKIFTEYDYAVGYLEGWSDRFLAFSVCAKKKYGWIHSTFKNVTDYPEEEVPWMSAVDKIIFVTDSCCDAFKRDMPRLANKTITIENIIDSAILRDRSRAIDITDKAYELFISAKVFRIVTVCRLTIRVKGLDRIVSSAKELKSTRNKFLWYIIGDGPDRQEVKTMIEKADIVDCVRLIGKRMNPYPFIAVADIMCMPSRYEGKPMSVTESLILGTPVVVTNYLSATSQIRNGVDGIVVQNTDSAIIPVLEKCINDPQSVSTMKENLKKMDYGNAGYIESVEKLLFQN